jgi:transposase
LLSVADGQSVEDMDWDMKDGKYRVRLDGLPAGAMAVIRYARQHGTKRLWLTRIMARRPTKVAAVALAYKIARMAWAIMARGERFAQPRLLPTAA